ncbi:MAG: hypothetical protein ABSH06_23215 [Thermodesulfobacteriota bacterium]
MLINVLVGASILRRLKRFLPACEIIVGSMDLMLYLNSNAYMVGGYAISSWFVLVEVLGYKNVKIYDGSAQEWTRDAKAPVVIYKWE